MAINDELLTLPTPSLILEEERMLRNIGRLRARLDRLGVPLRPHLKTVKSVDAARRLLPQSGGAAATVSTLREAEVFADAGISDIIYAVGIVADKLPRVLALRQKGCDLSVILDTIEQAEAVCAASREAGNPIPALIEIDSDEHRSGLRPADPAIIEIGRWLVEGGAELRGVLTHAGGSYGARSEQELVVHAEAERLAVVTAAATLKSAGLPCPVVSVGSTPTSHFAEDLSGVTEVRAGVFALFDLVMAGLGVCTLDDIAISVLTTVIGHQQQRGLIIVDAGWMAMSRDRGTAAQPVDRGYGQVCDLEGKVLEDLIVVGANQEHGLIAVRGGGNATLPDLPIGARLRILPNHACATTAQHGQYEVIPAGSPGRLEHWPIFRGW